MPHSGDLWLDEAQLEQARLEFQRITGERSAVIGDAPQGTGPQRKPAVMGLTANRGHGPLTRLDP